MGSDTLVTCKMSHDYYLPDPVNGLKDAVSGLPIPLCRKCGEWKGNAEDKCPNPTKSKKGRKAAVELHVDGGQNGTIVPPNPNQQQSGGKGKILYLVRF